MSDTRKKDAHFEEIRIVVNKFHRSLGSIIALGTPLLGGACAVVPTQAPPTAAPTTVYVTQPPAPDDAGKTEQQTTAKPATDGPQFDKDMFVSTYNSVSAHEIDSVQKPSEWLPQDVAGTGPAETLVMDAHWARWDKQEARGNCIVRLTGGGGPPQLIKNVRIIFSNAQYKDGKLQYTHYRLEWPDGTAASDRDIDIEPW